MALAFLMLISVIGFIISKRILKYKIFLPLFVFLGGISLICVFELPMLWAMLSIALLGALLILLVWVMNTSIDKLVHKKGEDYKPRLWGSILSMSLSLVLFAYAFVFNGIETFSDTSEYFRCYSQTALSHYILPARVTMQGEKLTVYSVFECRSEYLRERKDIFSPAVTTEVFWHNGKLLFNQYGSLSTQEGEATVTREYRTKRRVAPVESPYEK